MRETRVAHGAGGELVQERIGVCRRQFRKAFPKFLPGGFVRGGDAGFEGLLRRERGW